MYPLAAAGANDYPPKRSGKAAFLEVDQEREISLAASPPGAPDRKDQRDGSTRKTRVDEDYMLSIITCPKPEQDTCVAPSISRAKS